MNYSHKSVLLNETVGYLTEKNKTGVFVDATLGFGGHSKAVLEIVSNEAVLVGMDRDDEALEIAGAALKEFDNFRAIKTDYRNIDKALEQLKVRKIAGIIYDLGVSSLQLDKGERGFSFNFEAPLDMRMDSQAELTAYDVVNTYKRVDLENIIRDFGEEPEYKKITDRIMKSRPINNTLELADIVRKAKRGGEKIHPATKVFQAIRIEVNDELNGLEESLKKAIDLCEKGARICVISFHSLEDRIVKKLFLSESKGCSCGKYAKTCTCGNVKRLNVLTKKPVMAGKGETGNNPRARSAKLRVAERV